MDVVSFTVNHDKMVRGVYKSRLDYVGGNPIVTFDIRMKIPNREPVLDNPSIHTMEHLMAVYLRGKESGWAEKIIYIGPMGCRTGMYLILNGNYEPSDILPLLKEMFLFIINFNGSIPATTSIECGNYLEHNLVTAKWEAKRFYDEVLTCIQPENLIYPE